MSAPQGTEPIADDEVLYRRIPASQGWYAPGTTPPLSEAAFGPTKHDSTGISVSRAKYKTLEEAACGREGKRYYVAVLRAGDLRAQGIEVIPRPLEGDPGHGEIPGLTYDNRKSDQALEWKVLLAHQLCLRVEGPFPP
jgi:hypothetical protein